jgi:hypothetical protein
MPSGRLYLAIFTAALIAGTIGTLLIFPARHSQPTASADPWRRTAKGWEKIDSTHAARPERVWQSATAPQRSPRLDTHPAVVALGQILTVLLALAAFPPGRRQQAWAIESWSKAIRRSFRASAFGS